jgi:hypothetical protein
MIKKLITPWIFGDAEVAGTLRSRLLELLRRSDFSGQRKKPELLPLNAADCACSRTLTKNEDKETITINLQADPLILKRNLS